MLFFVVGVAIFTLGVLVWFFTQTTTSSSGSIINKTNPLSLRDFPKRFQFIGNPDTEEEQGTSTTEITLATPQILTKIWDKPSSGQAFVVKEYLREVSSTSTIIKASTSTKATTTEQVVVKKTLRATSTILMFVDRETGHIYGFSFDTNKVFQISNSTFPGIHDAYIIFDGTTVVMRYEDEEKRAIVGIMATIPSVAQGQDPRPLENITYLPSQVISVASSPDKTLLSYVVDSGTDVAVYTMSKTGTQLITKTPFKEWSLVYGGNTLHAYTKPSAYVEGYMAKLPTFEMVTPGRTGLISLPSNSSSMITSMWSNKGLLTYITSLGKDTVLPIKTLASKCAWGTQQFILCAVPRSLPRGSEGLPDDWYQGRVSFDDTFILVDSNTGETSPLFSFDGMNGLPFDVTNIILSEDSSLVSFIRKQDGSLWLLNTNLLSGAGETNP
jgi:hypothetical protein